MLINLKKFRIKNNLTQAQLSKLIGYDQTIISQWEHGSRDPNTDTLLSIAKILNVSTDSLVGNDKCEVNNYAEENKEVEDLRDEQKANLYLIKQLNTTNNLIANGYLLRLLQEQEQKNKQ